MQIGRFTPYENLASSALAGAVYATQSADAA